MEEDVAAGFAALAQATRIGLVRLLAARGADGARAGELATALRQPPSTLSFHLSALERAGLVRAQRRGRHVVYTLHRGGLRPLALFLADACCGGDLDAVGAVARLLPNDPIRETHMATYNVLFICTRNSARSIMAEAILAKVGAGRFNAYSAGSDPAPAPMPEVLERLRSLGHDVTGLRSKSWAEFGTPEAPRMDFVLTLCDPGEGESCPDLGEHPITATWPFPDPARFTGAATERATLLAELYGMIRRRLESFTNLPFDSLDRMTLRARIDELGDSARLIR
jgi:arsenate reductase